MALRTCLLTLLAVIALWAATAQAGKVQAGEVPVVGGYGFDWLQPSTTSCRRITAADRSRFRSCVFRPSGNAFGLPLPYQECTISAHSQVLIYASPALCQEAFDTMQANGD